MTRRRDPDQLIKTYLADGPEQLSNRTYDAVRAEIDHTRQRAVFGPWRVPTLNNYARYGIAAAAVVLVAVLGLNLMPRSTGSGGPGVSPTTTPEAPPPATQPTATAPQPTPTSTIAAPSASGATRLPFDHTELAAGTYFIDDFTTTRGTHLQFTLPAGWDGASPVVARGTEGVDQISIEPWVVTHIFANGCQWDEDDVVEVGTVDEIVDALADQAGREASAPTEVTIGGVAATRIVLTTSPELDVSTCTNGNQRYWPGPGPDFTSGLCCHDGVNTDIVYVVDTEVSPLVIVARHYPGSSAQDVAELQSIVDSIQIEP